jgi:uncharacterized RDD family membrane protein YckC
MRDNNLKIADQSTRAINLFIDMIAIVILWALVIRIIILLGLSHTLMDESGEAGIFPLVLFFIMFWSYYVLLESLFQRTLGKLLTKTKVVNEFGAIPSLLQIIGRTLCRNIPFEYFSYFVDDVGMHDKLSGTRVIENK